MIPSFLHTYMQFIKVYLIGLKCTRIWPVLRQTGNQTVEKRASEGDLSGTVERGYSFRIILE